MASSSSSLQEARAGVAERWIASHAGSVTNDSPHSSTSSSPTHSIWPTIPNHNHNHNPNPNNPNLPNLNTNNNILNGSPPSGLYGFGSVLGNNRGGGPPKTGYFHASIYPSAPNAFPKACSVVPNMQTESFRMETAPNKYEHQNHEQIGQERRGINNEEFREPRSNNNKYGHGNNELYGPERGGNNEQDGEGRGNDGRGENGSTSFFPLNFNEKLYEAYNDLHCLAQSFRKPFDAPAILVVGHQTDGKSALVEALMGFQFNHVGGGTKTRRPITLHMKYNSTCLEPVCYLVSDSGDEEKSLEELQVYIEAENMRLERDPCQFSAKEIIVKIEYKYCPNLTIIDTPGLIAAPPSRKNQLLQAQARAVEALVRTKMQSKEYIILCLEDCSDWSNATTRRVVMQMDQELSRTVIVSTKLDTRIPQFARAADVELFLKPPHRLLDGNILGDTPFFTSVPSGRVGGGRDSVYRSNDQFREAIAMREAQDVTMLEEKLDRVLSSDERDHVGVSRLRWFLEQILQQRYLESVPLIVPLLDREYRNASRKLQQTNQDLGELDEVRLKERGRLFRDSFLAKLSLLLKGTVVAPPEKFGEMLQDERVNGGAFVGSDGLQMPFKYMPNAGMRLYGGAQYHRAMAEFRFVVGSMKCPAITREEIVNACGVEDIHDGTNYFRTACVIAVAKARDVFEPFLYQLGFRLSHILRRLLPIALYLLQKDGEYLSGHNMFMKRVSAAFHTFVETTERGCREKCMEDLMSTTRYVTWSLHNKNRSGLHQFLDTFPTSDSSSGLNMNGGMTQGSDVAIPSSVGSGNKQDTSKSRQEFKGNPSASTIETSNNQTTQARLVDLLESTLWNRRLAPSSEEIVNTLVAQIFDGIRDHFVTAAELKFNCFFLMPVVEKFPALLRDDLEAAFEEDLDSVFDVVQARRTLEQQRIDLEFEMKKVERLQEKFMNIHKSLRSKVATRTLPRKEISAEMSLLKVSEKLLESEPLV